MARIFLINPEMDIATGFGDYQDFMEAMPVIGLAYIASICRREGHEVRCLDNFCERRTHDDIAEEIRRFKPDVIGIGILTPSARTAMRMSKTLREAHPSAHIVLGNLHASVFHEELVGEGYADTVLHGEVEHTFLRLVEMVTKGGAEEDVPGLSFVDNGTVRMTKLADPPTDLDDLPRPAWDLFPQDVYTFLPFVTVAKPCLSLLATRGCPFHCKYCALGYQGHKVRRRSPDNIAAEVEWLVRDWGIRHVGFVDPIFPVHKRHGLETCQAIIERKIPGRWWWTTETRVDVIDEEICRAMKAARCKRVLFGIESGVDALLKNVDKKCTAAKVREGVTAAKKAGLEITAFFMLGLPGETAEMTRETIDFALSLDLDIAKFGITVPYPGTELYETLLAEGRIKKGEWEQWSTFNPNGDNLPFVPDGMTGPELDRLHKRANWLFFMRPRIIWRHLFVVRSIKLSHMMAGFRLFFRQFVMGQI
ncbi:MAG: radical SAM protein [Deltaproteobacteria bacterium]|nr:radical SAM protein [Deltaproteobacteria bacterium]